ncbi:MAG TPA: hypothetical protein VHX88_17865 [Solirubrobacteraceae bacterium]|jgi:hypothetical protein|nr:hypothetical protein [Solirubrobacteraceae bacterium]
MPPNLGAAIYGAITVGALLAAESAKRETYGETVAAVGLALVLYWLAHGYAEFLSRRLQHGKRLTAIGLAETMWHELPILAGAALPLAAVLIAWAAGAGLGSAISAAVWIAGGTIVVIEIAAGVRAKLSGRELVLQALLGAALGVLVLALRLVLH